ncbi:MAG: hypothetical protein AAGC74_09575, partial [Verrucomicrobiota bacterium]
PIGGMPELDSEVRAIGYPIGGDRLSVSRGIVSRIDFRPYSHSPPTNPPPPANSSKPPPPPPTPPAFAILLASRSPSKHFLLACQPRFST